VRSAFGTAIATVVVGSTTAATGTALIEGTATSWRGSTSVAAIFPATRTRAPLTTAVVAAAATAVVATTATAVVAPPATAAEIATRGTATGLSFVDAQGTPHQLSTLQRLNGRGFSRFVAHFDKRKAALTTGVTL
jgi:hypothetical protein